MKASVETINSVQRRVKVEVPLERVNQEFAVALRKAQQQARIKGFRPGKAPMTMIRRMYLSSLTAEVGESLVNSTLFEALKANEIRPISSPVLEKLEAWPLEGKEFAFSAIVDVMPVIAVKDYRGMSLKGMRYEVTDGTVDSELERLRRRNAKTRMVTETTAKAANGQVVVLGQHAQVAGGAPIPQMTVDRFSIELGRGELFPNLENALLNMSAGEEKDVNVTLPSDYNEPEFAGKDVSIHLKLHEIHDLIVPAADDEFAKDLDHDTLASLRAALRERLEESATTMRRRGLESAAIQTLMERHSFDVPPSMVDEAIDSMIREQRWPSKEALQHALRDSHLRTEVLPVAKQRVGQTLLLWQLAQQEKIEPTEADLRAYLIRNMRIGANAPASEVEKRVEMLLRSGGARLRELATLEKAMDLLISAATVTDESMPLEKMAGADGGLIEEAHDHGAHGIGADHDHDHDHQHHDHDDDHDHSKCGHDHHHP